VIIVDAVTVVNSRPIIRAVFGHDKFAGGVVRLVSSTEIEVRGPLDFGIAQRAADLLKNNPGVRVVHVNSGGGWIVEGQLLASVISGAHLQTYTSTGCFSACTIAFLAGTSRTIAREARLGFHSASGEGMDPLYIAAAAETLTGSLVSAGAPPSFISRAAGTPAVSMWYPDPSLLLMSHIVQTVADDGLSPSGEPMTDFAEPARRFMERYAAIDAVRAVDGKTFAAYDRSVRLLLRRNALEAERTVHVARFLGELERDRSRTVSATDGARFWSAIAIIAAEHVPDDPEGCLLILGGGERDISQRPAKILLELDLPLTELVSAPTGDPAPAGDVEMQLNRIAARAVAIDPEGAKRYSGSHAPDAAIVCRDILWLTRIALGLDAKAVAALFQSFRTN
jgi:hypothetical protein